MALIGQFNFHKSLPRLQQELTELVNSNTAWFLIYHHPAKLEYQVNLRPKLCDLVSLSYAEELVLADLGNSFAFWDLFGEQDGDEVLGGRVFDLAEVEVLGDLNE